MLENYKNVTYNMQPKRATSAFSFEIPPTSMAKPEACGQIVLPDL